MGNGCRSGQVGATRAAATRSVCSSSGVGLVTSILRGSSLNYFWFWAEAIKYFSYSRSDSRRFSLVSTMDFAWLTGSSIRPRSCNCCSASRAGDSAVWIQIATDCIVELASRGMQPRRRYFTVSVANHRSTWLNQEAEVGVKCTWEQKWRANHGLI